MNHNSEHDLATRIELDGSRLHFGLGQGTRVPGHYSQDGPIRQILIDVKLTDSRRYDSLYRANQRGGLERGSRARFALWKAALRRGTASGGADLHGERPLSGSSIGISGHAASQN